MTEYVRHNMFGDRSYVTVLHVDQDMRSQFIHNGHVLTVKYEKNADQDPVITGFYLEKRSGRKKRFDHFNAQGQHQGRVADETIRLKKAAVAKKILIAFLEDSSDRYPFIDAFDQRAVKTGLSILQQANQPG